uniref:Uncharacterized protein n=1 Tax=Arundo donax TaxID=35708 RepID=A0A0A8ZWE6_ARUDO
MVQKIIWNYLAAAVILTSHQGWDRSTSGEGR